jgi:hypothetical protein
LLFLQDVRRHSGQREPGKRSASKASARACRRRRVVEGDLAEMLLDDLLDDREAEAGARTRVVI